MQEIGLTAETANILTARAMRKVVLYMKFSVNLFELIFNKTSPLILNYILYHRIFFFQPIFRKKYSKFYSVVIKCIVIYFGANI